MSGFSNTSRSIEVDGARESAAKSRRDPNKCYCAACGALLVTLPTEAEDGAIHRQFRVLHSRYRDVAERLRLPSGETVEVRDRPMVCARESCIDRVESDQATWKIARIKKSLNARHNFERWAFSGDAARGPIEPWEL